MAQRTSLSLQPEDSHGTDERPSPRGGRPVLLLLLLLLIAAGMGAGGYELLRRMQSLEQQVAALSARTGEVEARARQAADQAAASEAAAQRAAEGRQAAETQTAEARQAADVSKVQADEA